MFLDIHRHSSDKGKADKVLRNLFHNQTEQISTTDFCSIGLHPWHVSEKTLSNDIMQVKNSVSEEKVYAIGEAGIDKTIKTDLLTQREAFVEQIELAKLTEKPMIIHCVRAYDELQSFRKKSEHKQPWIFHWYNASPQTGFDLISKGCYLSFGHMLFKETSKAFRTFMEVPIDNIFFETDDADISIKEVYKRASELKRISITKLQKQINTNFSTCFGIEL